MALLFYSVVRRHMRSVIGFTLHDETHPFPVVLPLEPGESLIGSYRNPAPWESTMLAFTSNAICIVDEGETRRIPLRDIVDYEAPQTKSGVTGLVVRTREGSCFIRVAGSHGPSGKYKDFIALMRVLRAVLRSGDLP